jgi:hypothetical protein
MLVQHKEDALNRLMIHLQLLIVNRLLPLEPQTIIRVFNGQLVVKPSITICVRGIEQATPSSHTPNNLATPGILARHD